MLMLMLMLGSAEVESWEVREKAAAALPQGASLRGGFSSKEHEKE